MEFYDCCMYTIVSSCRYCPRACYIIGVCVRSKWRIEILVLRGGHVLVSTASQRVIWYFRSPFEGQLESVEIMLRICAKDQQQARGSEIERCSEGHNTTESVYWAIKFNDLEIVITCCIAMNTFNYHFKGGINRCNCTNFIVSV